MSVKPEDLAKGRLYTVIFNGNTCTANYMGEGNSLYVFADKDYDLKPFMYLTEFELDNYVKEIEEEPMRLTVRPEDLVVGKLYNVQTYKRAVKAWYTGKRNNNYYRFVIDDVDKDWFLLDWSEVMERVKEIEEEVVNTKAEAPEPDTYKPDHYYKNSFKVSDVQEEIGYNVFKALGSDEKAYKSSVWVTYALKHLCRAGNKDDVKLELKKSINYLTKALEGEFISE